MGIELIKRSNCPICDSDSQTFYKLPYSNNRLHQFLTSYYGGRANLESLSGENYQINQCRHCGFLFQSPILNEEGQVALYETWVDQENSLLKKQQAKAKLFRQYAGQMENISRLINKSPQQIEILEYGMGWGYWCRMASAFGYQVQGLELSPKRVEHARKFGIEVINALPDAGPRYDFIFANQVFEHLDRPLETLIEMRDRLKPGGFLHLRVPDGHGIERQLRRAGWGAGLDAIHPLEHINCFTRKTLLLLGQKAGLTVVHPPWRIDISRFWGGVKRELNDRWLTTHVYFQQVGK